MCTLDDAVLEVWLRERLGYGTLDAPFWFIGMEESCAAAPGDELAEMSTRLRGGATEDLAEVLRRLSPRYDGLLTSRLQPTWRRLLRILFAAQGEETPTDSQLLDHQSNRLGRATGETFLAEFFPLPSPKRGVWNFDRLSRRPDLRTRAVYERTWEAARADLLRAAIRRARPRWVVAYGSPREFWPRYRRVLGAQGGPRGTWCDVPGVDGRPFGSACGNAVLIPHPVRQRSANLVVVGRWLRTNGWESIPVLGEEA